MKRLLKYFKGYRFTALTGPFFKLLEALFELYVPLVVAQIIDNGILKNDKDYIVRMSLFLVLLGFVGFLSAITAQYFAAKTAVGFAGNVRGALFNHLLNLSFADTDNLGTATMITRLTNDIDRVQNGVNMALRLLLRSPLIVFGAMIMAFTRDVKAALIFVIIIPILLLIVSLILKYTLPKYKEAQRRLDKVLNITRDNVNGVRVVRAFKNEQVETEKFDKANESLRSLQVVSGKISTLTNPLTYVIINFALMFMIYVCGIRVNNGSMSTGTTIALYNYMSQILIEVIKLANLIVTISRALASAERVADILDIKPGMANGTGESGDDEVAIRLSHASISYSGNGQGSLTDVSFEIKKGQTVGVIGGTGSGKSTLISLIPRFYDVTEGSVQIFGSDVRELDKGALRDRIGVVLQHAVLFDGDVKSNLEFANAKATEDQMWLALKTAQCQGFVHSLDMPIREGGTNLSGGQRQRLGIARALIKKPDVLILDDSTSALDNKTEKSLLEALKELHYHPTILIVSQKVSSIMRADNIIVLDNGRMVGNGTHEELLVSNETYREIYESQLRAGGANEED